MKKAIITGASSGLGYEISKLLLKKDISIINLSRNKPDLKDIIHIKTDLSNKDSVQNALLELKKNHSDANILILNSGLAHWAECGNMDDVDIDNDFNVNVISHIKLTNALSSTIEKNKGDIVFIGSTACFNSSADSLLYSSTKHAVLGFLKSLQVQMKKKDVRVFGVHPGGFQSQFHVKTNTGLSQEKLMSSTDLAKMICTLIELPRSMEVSEIIINRKSLS